MKAHNFPYTVTYFAFTKEVLKSIVRSWGSSAYVFVRCSTSILATAIWERVSTDKAQELVLYFVNVNIAGLERGIRYNV